MEINFKSLLKRCASLGIAGMLAVSLQGCSFVMSDSGSDTQKEIVKEDYLDLSILDKSDEEVLTKTYQTYTLEYGNFENKVLEGAKVFNPVTYSEKASFSSGTMVFDKFLVSKTDYVKAGDDLASVTVATDSIGIKEAELAHERLLQQYETAKQDRAKSIEDRDEILEKQTDEKEKKILLLQWQVTDLNWEKTDNSYKNRIASSKENIDELKRRANTTTIKAEHSGYVFFLEGIKSGDSIKNGQSILTLVPDNRVYVEVVDNEMKYAYGQELIATVSYGRNIKVDFNARVVNPSLRSVFCELNSGKAYFVLDMELNDYISKASIHISGVSSVVENVLLIPANYVTPGEKACYVTVQKDDGSLVRLPFIPGGSNKDYYWVLSGLEAGMKVIQK